MPIVLQAMLLQELVFHFLIMGDDCQHYLLLRVAFGDDTLTLNGLATICTSNVSVLSFNRVFPNRGSIVCFIPTCVLT